MNGRRLIQAELQSRARFIRIDQNSAALRAPMLGRKARRKRIRELRQQARARILAAGGRCNRHMLRAQFSFRPVYGYRGLA